MFSTTFSLVPTSSSVRGAFCSLSVTAVSSCPNPRFLSPLGLDTRSAIPPTSSSWCVGGVLTRSSARPIRSRSASETSLLLLRSWALIRRLSPPSFGFCGLSSSLSSCERFRVLLGASSRDDSDPAITSSSSEAAAAGTSAGAGAIVVFFSFSRTPSLEWSESPSRPSMSLSEWLSLLWSLRGNGGFELDECGSVVVVGDMLSALSTPLRADEDMMELSSGW